MKITPYFGCLPSEPDSRDFQMSDAIVQLEQFPLVDRTWRSKKTLSQGETPHCVGFSWAGWGIAQPVEDAWDNVMGHDIYQACKKVDGMPDLDGSTIRAGAKVMRTRGHFRAYYFSKSVAEIALYVSKFGPVVVGTEWYAGMSAPGLLNRMRIRGPVQGHHAYLILGIERGDFIVKNSWGPRWAVDGCARLSIKDMVSIFPRGGEACAASEKLIF